MKRHIDILTLLSIALAASVTATGCSDDEDATREGERTEMTLGLASRDYTASGGQGTRAMYADSDISYHVFGSDDENEMGESPAIRIYLGKTDGEYTEGVFTHANDYTWRSNVTMVTGTTYYVYGFMPRHAATSCSLSPTSGNYANGGTLTLRGISTASTSDLCYVAGVKKESGGTFNIGSGATALVSPGEHEYEASEGTNGNYLYVLMDHLLAKLTLTFKVEPANETPEHYTDGYYYRLRGIKLKKVEMTTSIGTTDIAIAFDNGAGTATVQSTPNDDAATQTIPLFDKTSDPTDPTGVELTPTGVTIPAFFAPIVEGESKEVTITSTYDVYYRSHTPNDEGVYELTSIVREDCTATNKLTISAPPGKAFGSGKQISVTAKVVPTYLYMLGDPDLDNPTIKFQ